jgi:uncharacterized protein YndB with AHSA1/START domain
MKWLLIVLGVIIVLIAAVALVGATLPEEHDASRAATYREPPAEVWRAISDFSGYSSWRPEVKSVEILPGQNGLPAWREIDSHGNSIPYQETEMHPPES